jgi:putative sporulation protein YtxC
MQLFSISLEGCSEEAVQEMLSDIHSMLSHLENKVKLDLQQGDHYAELRCSGVLPQFQLHVHSSEVLHAAANHLASYIISHREADLICDLLLKDYNYTSSDERQRLLKYCRQLMDESDEAEAQVEAPERRKGAGFARRQMKVAKEIHKYLEEYSVLNLEGFIRFRLKDYTEELRQIIDYAIEEFMLDQQYQEFIALLKYFVYVQESKIPEVHLVHGKNDDFLLLDEKLELLDTQFVEKAMTEKIQQDIQMEDMIVSTLISVAPAKLVIHTHEPEVQIIQTINQIFENRAKICTNCAVCDTLSGIREKGHKQESFFS